MARAQLPMGEDVKCSLKGPAFAFWSVGSTQLQIPQFEGQSKLSGRSRHCSLQSLIQGPLAIPLALTICDIEVITQCVGADSNRRYSELSIEDVGDDDILLPFVLPGLAHVADRRLIDVAGSCSRRSLSNIDLRSSMNSLCRKRKRDFISDAHLSCEEWRNQDLTAVSKDTFNPLRLALDLGDALATERQRRAGRRKGHVKPTPDYRPHCFGSGATAAPMPISSRTGETICRSGPTRDQNSAWRSPQSGCGYQLFRRTAARPLGKL